MRNLTESGIYAATVRQMARYLMRGMYVAAILRALAAADNSTDQNRRGMAADVRRTAHAMGWQDDAAGS